MSRRANSVPRLSELSTGPSDENIVWEGFRRPSSIPIFYGCLCRYTHWEHLFRNPTHVCRPRPGSEKVIMMHWIFRILWIRSQRSHHFISILDWMGNLFYNTPCSVFCIQSTPFRKNKLYKRSRSYLVFFKSSLFTGEFVKKSYSLPSSVPHLNQPVYFRGKSRPTAPRTGVPHVHPGHYPVLESHTGSRRGRFCNSILYNRPLLPCWHGNRIWT